LRLDLEDIRCWLLEHIDGGEEVRGYDSMLSTYINTIDAALAALPSETGPIPASKTQAKRFAAQMVEPRGCPTPGACSCPGTIPDAETPKTAAFGKYLDGLAHPGFDSEKGVLVSWQDFARTLERELIDLKQRILPQFQGRAQRAEHERDALLEELIAARKVINEMTAGVATWAEKWRDSK
jgi:hypothetical protein